VELQQTLRVDMLQAAGCRGSGSAVDMQAIRLRDTRQVLRLPSCSAGMPWFGVRTLSQVLMRSPGP
jgi:hypothetical protein